MLEGILVFVLLLGMLIFVHELGHFLVAKKIGIYVHKFSLGFGPTLFGYKGKETEYVFAPILLGGFVKMAGEITSSEDLPEDDGAEELTDEHLLKELSLPDERKFFNRSVSERIAVVVAGPLANFLAGIIVFSLIYLIGIPTIISRVGGVLADTPAQVAGLQKGDLITAINNEAVWRWHDMASRIRESGGNTLAFTIDRDGEELLLEITPEIKGEDTSLKNYAVGIQISDDPQDVKNEYFNPLLAPWHGLNDAIDVVKGFFYGLFVFAKGEVASTDMVAGPIGIYRFGEKMASLGIRQFLYFVGLISVNLAIINLFPVPILDGGMIVFFLIEKIKGSPISIRTRELAQQVGLVLLLSLIIFAFYSDLVRSY